MNYTDKLPALVLLADGAIFHGYAVGSGGTAFGEICFNTGMTGYQEIFTDPSYYGQIMVTANVHIGNYGATDAETESGDVKIAGLVCRNFSYVASRESSDETLQEFLNKSKLVAIEGIDTRALVSYIRDNGAQNAVISTRVDEIDALKKELAAVPSMDGLELASKVSTKETYTYGQEDAPLRIAALDIGVKENILRNLSSRGAYIKVFPHTASFEDLQSFNPDGYFLSNGPGDPQPLDNAIHVAKQIINSGAPLFGICLGHQVISLALGIDTFKMHNGHRGINHPILNKLTGKGEITSQNHGFAVNKEQALAHPDVEVTHMHLNDDTVAGLRHKSKPVFCVQYHPEAAPGPGDATYLFDQFIESMKQTQPA